MKVLGIFDLAIKYQSILKLSKVFTNKNCYYGDCTINCSMTIYDPTQQEKQNKYFKHHEAKGDMRKEGKEHVHCVKNINFHGRMMRSWLGLIHTLGRKHPYNQYSHERSHGILNLIYLLFSLYLCFSCF